MYHTRIPARCSAWLVVAASGLLVTATVGCAETPDTDASAPPPAHVRAALDDAAYRTGLPKDQITVVSVEQVTWRDSALGCPEPEKMYTQALVVGYRITIKAADKSFDYHADQHGRVLLCPPERAVAPLAPRADRPTR
jgi:hypothetical protein